ncbi:MAG TPA: POTRA domain-containing protein [Bryobacteraceae bacterium]|jgi:outer membrane protein insertion porin family|nr:POTRA domain-containing protein [Bryobacteraceae bacterium]
MRWLHPAVAVCVIAALVPAAALAQHPVMETKVAGNKRLPAAAVIAASGLRAGQMATRAQLDAAAKKLADTGFFSSVTYKYDPETAGSVTGYALTFLVTEQPAIVPVLLDIPDVDAERLWLQLKAADGLIDRQMPDNDLASAYYKRAIEAVLRKLNHPEEIVAKDEGDLPTHRMWLVFRPASLPQIAAIRFEGNSALSAAALEAAMAKVAIGQEYTERSFRRMLELNLRPRYEDLGHLTVAFPRVSISKAGPSQVSVTAAIDEGPAWRLGKVVIKGDALPLADLYEAGRFSHGEPANWKQFMATVHDVEQVLRRDGYLKVSSNPVRSFQDAAKIVDVNLEMTKGPQFLFGELHIEGLEEIVEERLTTLWKIPSGAPMNQPYIDEFITSAMPILRGKFRSFKSEMEVHPGEQVVDVTLKFR